MAINLGSNLNTGIPTYSVMSSSAANKLTEQNKSKLNSNLVNLGFSGGGVMNSPSITSPSLYTAPTGGIVTTNQNRPSTVGSVPAPTGTKTATGTTPQVPSVPATQGVLPPSSNPSIQTLTNQLNELIGQAGYLSPENQAAAQNINQLAGKELVALNNANSANQTGDYRSLNTYLKELDDIRSTKEAEITNLYDSLAGLRAEYATAAAPTQSEIDIQNRLTEVDKEARDYALATDRAVSGFEGQGRGIPLSLVRGQQKKLVEQRSYGATEIANEQANLLDRLGLEQDARELRAETAKNNITFVTDNAELLGKAVDRIDTQSNNFVSRFIALDEAQQKTLDNFFETVTGLSYDELDPASKNYVNNLAQNMGVPVSVIRDGMKALKDNYDFEQMIKKGNLAVSQANAAANAGASGGASGGVSPELNAVVNGVISGKGLSKVNAQNLRNMVETRGEDGLKDWASQYLLTTDEKRLFTANANNVDIANSVISSIDNAQFTTSGPWKDLWEKAKPWATMKKDQSYVSLLSAIEQGQASKRNALFGSALTPTESGKADAFLINKNDDLQTIKTKLQMNANIGEFSNDARVAQALGLPRPNIDDYIGKTVGFTKNADGSYTIQ